MDFGLSSTFQSVLQRYGIATALIGVFLLVVIYIAMRFALARIEAGRRAEDHSLQMQTQLSQQASQRDTAFLGAITAAREQNMKIMENHLAHDREEREAVVKAMTQMTVSQTELVEAIRAMRTESHDGSKAIHERLTQIQVDVARGQA